MEDAPIPNNHAVLAVLGSQVFRKVMLRQQIQEALDFTGELPESKRRVILELGFTGPGNLLHKGLQVHAVPVLK